MATDLERSVLLKLERDLEHLTDRFDRRAEDGDEITNTALEELRYDMDDIRGDAVALRAEIEELRKDFDAMRERFNKFARIVAEALA